MSKTFVVVLACLLAAAVAQETMILADFNLLRTVSNSTGATTTLPATPFPMSGAAGAVKGLVGLSLSMDGKTLYGANVEKNTVMMFDLTQTSIEGKVLAGGATAAAAAAPQPELVEKSGTAAAFSTIADMAMGADGNLYVLDSGYKVVRKVTPAGVVSTFSGAAVDTTKTPVEWTVNAAEAEGVATSAGFAGPTKIAASSDGKFLIFDSRMKEMDAEGTVTYKSATTASPGVNGVGTSASFDVVSSITFSADAKFAFVGENKIATPGLAAAAFGNTLSVVRKIDLSNFAVTTLAGATPAADGASADGTGTSVLFASIATVAADSAGNVFATEICDAGSVVRKITPAGDVSTHAGDLTVAACNVGPKVVATVDGSKTYFKNNVEGKSATFTFPTGAVMVQEVCGKFFPQSAVPDLSECEDLGGEVKEVKAKGKLQVKRPLIVNTLFIILAGGSVKADAPITVNGPFEVAGNGTVEINDNDVTANEVTLSNEGTYQILVARVVPGILKSKGIARIKGAFVLAVASSFEFATGASVSILEFASFEGNFAKVFFVKLRGRSASRGLLQNSASGANVACSGTSCQATGVTSSADDDDEVPFIVALIVVSALLFLAIVAAIYIASTGGSPFSKKDKVDAPAATAYGATQDDFVSTESSSSTYDIGFAPQFESEYTY